MKAHVNICGFDALIGMTAITDFCASRGITIEDFMQSFSSDSGGVQMSNIRGLFYHGVAAYAEYKELPFALTERRFNLQLDTEGFGIEEVALVAETLMKGFEGNSAKPTAGAKKK